MKIKVHNRCLYGSRMYGVETPDSDYNYLYIIADEDIKKAWDCLCQKQGTLQFANDDLESFDFQIASFNCRHCLLFFESNEPQTTICMLTLSHPMAS